MTRNLRCLRIALALAVLAAAGGCSEAEPTKAAAVADAATDLAKPKFDTGIFDSAYGDPGANPGSDASPGSDAAAETADSDPDVAGGDIPLADGESDGASGTDGGGQTDSEGSADAQPDADSGTTDAADGGCSVDSECDDNDPCTKNLCLDGQCSHPGNGSCCTTPAECDDNNACTADQCTSSGCVHTAASCDDGLPCTADGCDKVTGACKHLIKAGTCAISGICFAVNETEAANPCHRCDPAVSNTSWADNDGAACDDGNACTGKDECVAGGTCAGTAKAGCCKADSDCANSDPCVKATCTVGTGSCEAAPVVGCCTSGQCCDVATNQVLPAKTACGAAIKTEWTCNGKQAQVRKGAPSCGGAGPDDCTSDAAKLAWTAWQTTQTCTDQEKCVLVAGGAASCEPLVPVGCTAAAQCSDGKACTDDGCVQGNCVHLPKKCPSGLACQMTTCDDATGQCGLKPQPGICTVDGLCMTDGVKKPGDPCLACQAGVDPLNWTLIAACKCASGTCCDQGKVKPAGTACGSVAVNTEYSCAADGKSVRKRVSYAGCSGPGGTCSTSASLVVWQPWQTYLTCSGTTVCEVASSSIPGTCKAGADPACGQPDPQEAGTSLKTPYDLGTYLDTSLPKSLTFQFGTATDVDVVRWQLTDGVNAKQPVLAASWSGSNTVEVCGFYACSQGSNGKDCATLTCPAGAVAKNSVDVSGATVNGCCQTGSSGSFTAVPKAVTGSNTSGQGWLQVTNTAGKCHALALQLSFGQALVSPCTPGTTCCEDSGQFSAAAKPCGVATLSTEYKCESTALGGKLLQRKAVAGCSGTAAICSYSSANYAWSDWSVLKTCASSEVCSVTSPTLPGTCKVTTQCTPGSNCCTSAGQYATGGTLCGNAISVEYQCSANAIQSRKKFGSCSGSSATCSAVTALWTSWTTAKTCLSTEVCTPGIGADSLPNCVAKPADLCTVADTYETAEATASAYKFSPSTDASDPFWLVPKVKLQSSSDVDYLALDIADTNMLTDPKVYISWQAPAPVKVCAYYRCKAGNLGQNCASVVCPVGSSSATLATVSSVSGNGCCKTATSGTIDYDPDTPFNTDETGTAFFTIGNANPGCQEVAVKLASGGNVTTQCEPASTCCAAKGTWAAAGTACGNPLGFQNRCLIVSGSNQLQERLAMPSCSGTSAACSSATVAWTPWTLKEVCMAPELCASPVPQVPGACLVPPAGSCGGSCGYKSATGSCYCDKYCADNGDCCADFISECGGSCSGSCGGKSSTGNCFCDELCAQGGDCCVDKAQMCN